MTASPRCFPAPVFLVGLLLCASIPTLFAAAALAAQGDCGQPSSTGSAPKASDALFVLKAAVGSEPCDPCVCDVTDDTKIAASDALKVLKKAVGQPLALTCPACTPKLTGTLRIPSGVETSGSPGTGTTAAAASVVRLTGLVPAAGIIVEVLDLDAEGNPQMPAVASVVTAADGTFEFPTLPAPGSQVIVSAEVAGQALRAFVTGADVDVDPASEVVVASAIDAVSSDASHGLDSLTVQEIDSLVTFARGITMDFSGVTTIPDAVAQVDATTGGVIGGYVADFATGSGPAVGITGSYHMVTLAGGLAHSFTPGSVGVASVNERSVSAVATTGPLAVSGDGALSRTKVLGSRHTLHKLSGATPQQSGPDVAINVAAGLESADIDESPGAGVGSLLASDHGALLMQTSIDGEVSPGMLVAGSSVGVVPKVSSTASLDEASAELSFLVHQSQGLSNSSLSGTWAVLQLELSLQVNNQPSDVFRSVASRVTQGTISFDGNGHFSLGGALGDEIQLDEDQPTPQEAPADPQVVLSGSSVIEDPVAGLDYTLAANGVLTILSGSDVVAVGAVSPDRDVVVLRFGDDSGDSASAGLLVGVKRGSGLHTSTGSGEYRSVQFGFLLQANSEPGVPNTTPSVNFRAVGASASNGGFHLDGSGHVAVRRGMFRGVLTSETSGVLQHDPGTDEVLDAHVETNGAAEQDSDGNETHDYAISSQGVVTVDGDLEGYISPSGDVFILPQSGGLDPGTMGAGILIGLREP